jgi:hypothetical protein
MEFGEESHEFSVVFRFSFRLELNEAIEGLEFVPRDVHGRTGSLYQVGRLRLQLVVAFFVGCVDYCGRKEL